MSTNTLYRLSGYALLSGSSIVLLFELIRMSALDPSDVHSVTSLPWLIIHLTIMLGAILIVAGLPAVYIRLLKLAGWPGLVGVVLIASAILLFDVADISLYTFALPFIATHAPQLLPNLAPPAALVAFYSVANLLFCVGAILSGIMLIRAHVLPREVGGAGAALIAAGIINAVNVLPLQDTLWQLDMITSATSALFAFIALVGFAAILLSRSGAEAVQPARAVTEASSSETST